MGDMGDFYNGLREARRIRREKLGIECPRCAVVRPRACPSILLPGQRCKVDGYRDPRPRGNANSQPPRPPVKYPLD